MSQRAIDNAKAWFERIREMVEMYKSGGDDSPQQDAAVRMIEESPQAVLVRSGWHKPSARHAVSNAPAEYAILLIAGQPGLRIIGDLSGYPQPVNARLEWRGVGTPWAPAPLSELPYPERLVDNVLLRYASHFHFGE